MEFKKKTIIWEDNNEPPKDYIWAKKDGKFYEYSYTTRSWIESKLIKIDGDAEGDDGEGGGGGNTTGGVDIIITNHRPSLFVVSHYDYDQDKEVVLQTVPSEEIDSYLSSELGNIISNEINIKALYEDENYQNLDICQIFGARDGIKYSYMDINALHVYYKNAEVVYNDPQFSGYYVYDFNYTR